MPILSPHLIKTSTGFQCNRLQVKELQASDSIKYVGKSRDNKGDINKDTENFASNTTATTDCKQPNS